MSIFQTISNLNFGGTLHNAGSFFEGELEQYEALVKDGVLRVIEGAESVEHAIKLAEEEIASAPTPEEVKAPENTWGPKPDPTDEEVKEPEVLATTDQKEAKVDTTAPGTVGQGDVAPAIDPTAGDNL